jgi:hypothetical protein
MDQNEIVSDVGALDRTNQSWTKWKEYLTVGEISGSLGDMGTLLPILIALSKTGQVNLTSSLVFGGIFNIFIGAWFGIPLCVQPMKSIASIALANPSFRQQEVVAAGFYVSAVVLLLGITTSINWVNKLIPLAVVRGLQLGTGLVFMMTGVSTIQQSKQWTFTNFAWMDNYLIAILSLFLVLSLYHSRNTPSALILFLVGLIFSLVSMYALFPSKGVLQFGWYWPSIVMPAFTSSNAILSMALGQLPLTLLNSVIAVSKLADDLFPEKIRTSKLRPGAAPTIDVAISVGLFNVIGCWFGTIPYCSGSGGLAGQYRFGARSGLSVMILGVFKLFVGFTLGTSLLILLTYFPNSILGVMLAFSGLELAMASKDMGGIDKATTLDRVRTDNYAIMLFTAGMLVGWRNDGIAFLCGCLISLIFWAKRDVAAHGWKQLLPRAWQYVKQPFV